MLISALIIILILLGFWGLLCKRHLFKKIISLNIVNSGIIILFVNMGSRSGETAPILVKDLMNIVDPLPQALMLTAIVIGVSITAFGVCLIYLIFQKYRTLDIKVIEQEHLGEHE